MPKVTGTPIERILAKLATGPVRDLNECWPWLNSRGSHGYGQLSVNGRPELVHRLVYQALVGPIPEGYHIDHECHNDADCRGGKTCEHRACCNPTHLKPKRSQENADAANEVRKRGRFKTHCAQGHPYDRENSGWMTPRTGPRAGKPTRYCKACNRANVARVKAKKR